MKSPNQSNVFFIAGSQRSGTTLLAETLGRHPEIDIDLNSVGFRLISVFGFYKDILPYNLEHSWEELQSWLIDVDYKGRLSQLLDAENIAQYRSARELVNESIDIKLRQSNKLLFGDKAPNIQHYFNDVMSIMPDAKFIHIVRDGRATVSSQYQRAGKNIKLAAQEWVDGNILALHNQSLVGAKQYHIIKYEDLIHSPEIELRKLCEFLLIDFDQNLVADNRFENAENYVKIGFKSELTDKWKTDLKKSHITTIEKIQVALLKRFGYQSMFYEGKPKYISTLNRIYLSQSENFKWLFESKKQAMISGKVKEIKVPLKIRFKKFISIIGRDFLPERVYRRLFRSFWIKEIYYPKK